MCGVVDPGPKPDQDQDEDVQCICKGKAGLAIARDTPDKDTHHRHGQHLGERENPDTDVVRSVQVVIERAIGPRRPHRKEEKDEPTDSLPRWVLGQPVRKLGHDHHEDQVEEQLEEADPALRRAILESARRLPEAEPRWGGQGRKATGSMVITVLLFLVYLFCYISDA